jgi:hypothetical protein
MKKIALVVALFCAISFSATDVFAKAIGLKFGYAWMRDDYADAKIEDTYTIGVMGDLGTFLFDKLRFRPSFDYIELKPEHGNGSVDSYGIHLDWYWFFMDKQQMFSPFIGFGFGLNYYSYDSSYKADDDSDAGIELFAGTDMHLSGPYSLLLEARYVMQDFANRNQNMFKINLGVLYSF